MRRTLIDARPVRGLSPGGMAAPLRVGGSDAPLIDSFGRRVSYLRVSITDRCDLRCTYCMPERMTFLPKDDVLSFEELDRIVSLFAQFGVDKLRVTGGEPLVRRDVMALMRRFARHIEAGALRELTLTTNGTLLERYAAELADIGVKRINVSLDTLDRGLFEKIARRDRLEVVLAGIAAAAKAGLKVKINTVAMKGVNDAELPSLIAWAHGQGHDMTLIETMPMGEAETDRVGDYLSLSQAREELRNRWTLTDIAHSTGGPARYVRVEETGGRLGFITPLSHNFCESCNRVRLTCTGRLYTCLGREDGADLRAAVREHADDERLETLVRAAIGAKPRGHDFDASRLAIPASPRTMSHTGG